MNAPPCPDCGLGPASCECDDYPVVEWCDRCDVPASGCLCSRTPLDQLRALALTTAQLGAIEPPPSLVDGLLYEDTLTMLYGPSGQRKTFLALDLALHVSTGRSWNGRATKGAPVLYVVAEGVAGIGARVAAWEAHHGATEGHPITWLPMPVNLGAVEWAAALAAFATDIAAGLVIVDTVARCSIGLEENSAKDMGLLVEHADMIRRSSGACVVLVHHSGKSAEAGARGSSALRAAVGTELEVTSDGDLVTVRSTKQKDTAEAAPILLRAIPVADSLVLTAADLDTITADNLPAIGIEMLAALAEVDTGAGVSATQWKTVAEGVAERSFYRWRKQLLKLGLCHSTATNGRGPYRLTDQGKQLLPTEPCHPATLLPPSATTQATLLPPLPHPYRGGRVAVAESEEPREEPIA